MVVKEADLSNTTVWKALNLIFYSICISNTSNTLEIIRIPSVILQKNEHMCIK